MRPITILSILLAAFSVSRGAAAAGTVKLVETWPVETSLDHPDIADAHEVWREMIESASTRLELAHFYASNQPDSRLEAIIMAVEAAAMRGVAVRFLAEKKFQKTYPETLARLDAANGIEVRIFDVDALRGGVLHAKMMLVDGREAFVGSQNFDWRALEHIQELGLHIEDEDAVRFLVDVFETDWAHAGGADADARVRSIDDYAAPFELDFEDGTVEITPVASPKGWLPDESLWDLPRLVSMIDGASERVRVQLLTYKTVGYDKTYFDTLESALRRAAARGVAVELLLADWGKRRGTIEGLQSLQALRNVTVKLVTIPPWSGGFVPYGRVIHAKYLVVDGQRGWLGTSNWEKSYFFAGRNVGFVFEGMGLGRRLDAFFQTGWDSEYAYEVDPAAQYEPPRRD